MVVKEDSGNFTKTKYLRNTSEENVISASKAHKITLCYFKETIKVNDVLNEKLLETVVI